MDQDFYDYAVAAAVPDDDFYYVSWDNPIYDDFEQYDYSGMQSTKKNPVISIFNIVFLYRSCRSESKTYGYKYHCRLQHEATSKVKSRITSYSTLCFYRNVHFTKRLHILILLFLQRCISYDTAFTMQVSPKETLHKSLLFWVANPRV